MQGNAREKRNYERENYFFNIFRERYSDKRWTIETKNID